jgi:hypothetical protein
MTTRSYHLGQGHVFQLCCDEKHTMFLFLIRVCFRAGFPFYYYFGESPGSVLFASPELVFSFLLSSAHMAWRGVC